MLAYGRARWAVSQKPKLIRKNNNNNNPKKAKKKKKKRKEKTVKFVVQMKKREKEVSLCKRLRILERF